MNVIQHLSLWMRDLRQRNVKVMLAALVIAVATVATINLFADHLQRTLMTSASGFLAADRQLNSRTSDPLPEAWLSRAQQMGLQTGKMLEFSTMVSSQEAFQLVAVKAVDNSYPLRGELEWQADLNAERQTLTTGPAAGEVWLSARLLTLLALDVGDVLEVGATELTISGIILREPDGGFRLSDFAPRVMMHLADVEATQVIQPGSRVRHRGLLAGEEATLEEFYQWVEPQLNQDYRWVTVRQGETLAESLETAERFLLLGGSLAVLLAVVAIAVASREYASSQRDTVALLKTLGRTGKQIRRLYLSRLLVWGGLSMLTGLLIAVPAAWGLAFVMARMLDQPLAFYFSVQPLWPALLTAFVALFAFAFPPINRLRNTSAMRVLRSLPNAGTNEIVGDIMLAVAVIFGLLWVYVGQLQFVLLLMAAVLALMLMLTFTGWLLLKLLKITIRGKGSVQLAIIALSRHRHATLSQLSVFALTVMLAATLILVRSSLLADWQAQLPENAPNHFILNIAPSAEAEVSQFFAENNIEPSPFYPVIRGRLTEINQLPAEQVSVDPDNDEIRRELNLTTAVDYPEDNQIIAGQWVVDGEEKGVSLEQSLAESLGVGIGDTLAFSIGGEVITHPVTSIRSVKWDSMQPNFFIMFPNAAALQGLPSTALTSFYLDESEKHLLNDFVRQFPTISVLEIDHIIERIQKIIAQVTQAIEAILLMILLAAVAVMFAVVSATMTERQREGALLRTLGGQQKVLVRATVLEFAFIGLTAGILGVLAAEVAVWGLQYRMFEGSFRWHWPVVVLLPIISAGLLAVLGRWQLTPVLKVSPMVLLRRLE